MKYKLINKQSAEEHLCDKVIIDGFDYYVSKGCIISIEDVVTDGANLFTVKQNFNEYIRLHDEGFNLVKIHISRLKKVIATTNPSIDIPQVVNEVKELAKHEHNFNHKSVNEISFRLGFEEGYNKSQETHPFSEKDMIEFTNWCQNQYFYSSVEKKWSTEFKIYDGTLYTTKELLQIWKEQRLKIIYYE